MTLSFFKCGGNRTTSDPTSIQTPTAHIAFELSSKKSSKNPEFSSNYSRGFEANCISSYCSKSAILMLLDFLNLVIQLFALRVQLD